MILPWFIAWLIEGTPHISFHDWNDWTIALVICAILL